MHHSSHGHPNPPSQPAGRSSVRIGLVMGIRRTGAWTPSRHLSPPPREQSGAPTTARPRPQRGPRQPRPVDGQSGGGGAQDPKRPTQRSEAPPRGRPAAAPTTPSQVGGNRDRTAPPQAIQTEHGTGAGHAEGHGPRGTALPAPSAGTTRDARATPPSGERTPRERERAHREKDTRGLPEGQPDRARGTHRPHGMAYQRARVDDTRTGRPATRSAEHAGREGGKRGDTTPGTGPNPPEPAASAAHTQTGHCTRQGSSGARRHAPTPRLGSLRASPRGSHWRQASSTGPAAPAHRATTH